MKAYTVVVVHAKRDILLCGHVLMVYLNRRMSCLVTGTGHTYSLYTVLFRRARLDASMSQSTMYGVVGDHRGLSDKCVNEGVELIVHHHLHANYMKTSKTTCLERLGQSPSYAWCENRSQPVQAYWCGPE